MARFLSLL